MSSSPTSSSSTDAGAVVDGAGPEPSEIAGGAGAGVGAPPARPSPPGERAPADDAPRLPFDWLLDLRFLVEAQLGTGSLSVRRCLTLQPAQVLKLDQSAGENLQLVINGINVARGEVVIFEDGTAVRVTEIVPPPGAEVGT